MLRLLNLLISSGLNERKDIFSDNFFLCWFYRMVAFRNVSSSCFLMISISWKTQNYPQTSQTTHKPVKPFTNHPQTSHKHRIISWKSVFYVAKNFNNNAKHMLSLQPFHAITLTFSSEDQSQVGIEGKWREII